MFSEPRYARPVRLLVPVVCLLVMAASESVDTVRVERIDGAIINATWLGLRDGNLLEFHTPTGPLKVPLDELAAVEFPTTEVSPPTGGVTLFLNDGGMMTGQLLDAAEEGIVVKTSIAERSAVRFDRLAAIRLADPSEFPRAEEILQSTLRQRAAGQDVLITRSLDEPKTVRGRIETLDAARGAFAFGETSRAFVIERMYAIVFAAGATQRTPLPAMCRLTDGSTFSVSLLAADAEEVSISTSFETVADLPLTRIAALQFLSDRLSYLSDRTPVEQRTEGRLHRPWPTRVDRNVAGGPISLGGRVFRKGLGVHSFTELVYELDGPYESFAATVGIDDAVRPRGSVVLRVFGEGVIAGTTAQRDTSAVRVPGAAQAPKGMNPTNQATTEGTNTNDARMLWDSGLLSGKDVPKDILLDVRGFRRLRLVVDYGEHLDLSDYANWAAARLIKPVKPAGSGSTRPNP